MKPLSYTRHGLAATSGTRTRTGPPRAKKYEILFSILIAKKRIKKLLRGSGLGLWAPYQGPPDPSLRAPSPSLGIVFS